MLDAALGLTLPARDEAGRLARLASADDYLDAVVAAWSARRLALGLGGRLPAEPTTGSNGLRMDIAY